MLLVMVFVVFGFSALLNSVNESVVSLLEIVFVVRVGMVFLVVFVLVLVLFGFVEEVCFVFSVVVMMAVSSARVEFEDVDVAVSECVK